MLRQFIYDYLFLIVAITYVYKYKICIKYTYFIKSKRTVHFLNFYQLLLI